MTVSGLYSRKPFSGACPGSRGEITESLVGRLRCKAIAGAANNQLESPAVDQALHARDIFYAPDYAINAGGLINVAIEYAGYDRQRSTQQTLTIYDTIATLIERSRREKCPPGALADRMAEERLQG